MRSGTIPLFPEVASTMASRVDGLYLFLVGLTAFFTILIAVLIAVFMVKYKRRTPTKSVRASTAPWRWKSSGRSSRC
jgi:heme/copper-type cytochrome/quinol oxidase subunit 2